MTEKQLEFFFDVAIPASYLAYTQLPSIVRQTGAKVVLRPMLLGGVFHATGNGMPSAVAAKGRWLFNDFSRFAKRYGVGFQTNPHFSINTLTLMRGVAGRQLNNDPRLTRYLETTFHWMWVEPRNLNEAH